MRLDCVWASNAVLSTFAHEPCVIWGKWIPLFSSSMVCLFGLKAGQSQLPPHPLLGLGYFHAWTISHFQFAYLEVGCLVCFYFNISYSHALSLSINGRPISQKNVVPGLGLSYSNILNFCKTVSHNVSCWHYPSKFTSIDRRRKLFIASVRHLLAFYPFLRRSLLAVVKF